jgi:hypothetical protein
MKVDDRSSVGLFRLYGRRGHASRRRADHAARGASVQRVDPVTVLAHPGPATVDG